jgi:hypothetical protein
VDDQQQSRWPTKRQILWASGIIAVIVGAYIFLRFAYVREWKWTGLVKNPDFHKGTLWDWLSLLIVPAVLALGGYLFTRSESRRTQEDAYQQRRVDREIADECRQDDMLQAYLDGMSQLLTDNDRPLHRAQVGDSRSTVARARTLTVLPRLDGDRKARVVQFLYESDLISKTQPILTLSKADLSGAGLGPLYVGSMELRNDLSDAKLVGTNLSGAYLSGADLNSAKGTTKKQLERVKSLKGATMPNGQKYEDWLKDTEKRQQDE